VPLLLRGGWTYRPFGPGPRPDYAVFVEGSDQNAAKYAGLIAVSLSSIKQYYDERYDRGNFHQERHPRQHPAGRHLPQGPRAAPQFRRRCAPCC
jgi:hypothetical protein